MKSVAFVVLFSIMLLAGCIDLGGSPPTQTNQSTQPTQPSNTSGPSIVIISETNTTAAHNETLTPVEPQPPKLNYTYDPDAQLAVYFVAVADAEEQGDAIVINKGEATVLVDAGPDADAGKLRDFLKSKNIDDFQLVVSTHADPEHYSGFKYIINNYDIGEFWWMGDSFNVNDYESLIGNVAAKKIPTRIVYAGDTAEINGMKIQVLNPTKLGGAFGGTDGMDNDAIVLKITDRKFCILLTSDILYGAQTTLLNTNDLSCKVLQIPHHGMGAGNNMIELFLREVKPEWAVISGAVIDPAGDKLGTRFGVYQRLNLTKTQWLANYDGLGTVKVVSDGTNYAVLHDLPS